MRKFAYICLAFGTVVLLGYIALLCYHGYIDPNKPFRLSVAKDMGGFVSGFVGVFFSAASLLLVIDNLRAQALRDERAGFEKVFFDMLNLHERIIKELDTQVEDPETGGQTSCKGKGFFDELGDAITREYNKQVEMAPGQNGSELLVQVYWRRFMIHNSDLGHYYRSLFHIVRYVATSPYLNRVECNTAYLHRTDYFRILRAQLTNGELVCLALNGLISYGSEFKKLLEEHQLLKNLNFELSMPDDYRRRVPAPEILATQYPLSLTEAWERQKVASGNGTNPPAYVPPVPIDQCPFVHHARYHWRKDPTEATKVEMEVVDTDRYWVKFAWKDNDNKDCTGWLNAERIGGIWEPVPGSGKAPVTLPIESPRPPAPSIMA